jgi:hypothetical protein
VGIIIAIYERAQHKFAPLYCRVLAGELGGYGIDYQFVKCFTSRIAASQNQNSTGEAPALGRVQLC